MSDKPSFIAELERRNVLRAGVLYAGAVWALAQGISQLGPSIGLPNWTTRWFLVAAVIGFPFWIAFAWFYEFTPSGLKRESDIAPGDSIAHSTGRKLDFWIIGILAVAVVLLATNQFVLHRDVNSSARTSDAKAVATESAKVPEKSVAVLPLTNESGDPKQQYFSDGLSEELISDLTQINGLKVIGKYSSFKFRDSKDSPEQIGTTLGVAHLIQGSVRQQGDHIRVTIGMVRAVDGVNVWSHRYDEPLKDVFAIQTEIGDAVAAALKITLMGQTLGMDDKPSGGDVEAYKLMLQGRAVARHDGGTEDGRRRSITLYQQALKLDPNYAYAWGSLSNSWVNLGTYILTGDARQRAYAQARAAANRQQALAPDAAMTHLIHGYVLRNVDNDPVGSLAEYQRAYALAPNDGGVMNFLSGGLQIVGQLQPAAELMRKAIATDPLRADWYASLTIILLAQGQLDAAEQALRKAQELQPDTADMYGALSVIDILRGDSAAALRNANRETDPDSKAMALTSVAQIEPDRTRADGALRDYIAQYGKTQPYNVADLYALRKQPDDMFEWLERAWTQHDPTLIYSLLSDPYVMAYQHDPRFAALCRKIGLPPPGEASPTSADTAPVDSPPAGTDAATAKP